MLSGSTRHPKPGLTIFHLQQVIADLRHDDLQRPQNRHGLFGSFTSSCLGQGAAHCLKLVHAETSWLSVHPSKLLANPHLCVEVKRLQTCLKNFDELLVRLAVAHAMIHDIGLVWTVPQPGQNRHRISPSRRAPCVGLKYGRSAGTDFACVSQSVYPPSAA